MQSPNMMNGKMTQNGKWQCNASTDKLIFGVAKYWLTKIFISSGSKPQNLLTDWYCWWVRTRQKRSTSSLLVITWNLAMTIWCWSVRTRQTPDFWLCLFSHFQAPSRNPLKCRLVQYDVSFEVLMIWEVSVLLCFVITSITTLSLHLLKNVLRDVAVQIIAVWSHVSEDKVLSLMSAGLFL